MDASDAAGPDADLVVCSAIYNTVDNTVSLGIQVVGQISPDYQYRISLDYRSSGGTIEPDGNPDKLIKYKDGQWTGLSSLIVIDSDPTKLLFEFDAGEIGLGKGNLLAWFAEVQGGVASSGSEGFLDRAPDTGFLEYMLEP